MGGSPVSSLPFLCLLSDCLRPTPSRQKPAIPRATRISVRSFHSEWKAEETRPTPKQHLHTQHDLHTQHGHHKHGSRVSGLNSDVHVFRFRTFSFSLFVF